MKVWRNVLLLHVRTLSFSATAVNAAEVKSPDERVVLSFDVKDFEGAASCPVYSVAYRGKVVVSPSRLGLALKAAALAEGLQIVRQTESSVDAHWKPVYGERSTIRDHYNQVVVELQERDAPHRFLQLTLRAYDEGAAFCYTLPKQSDMEQVTISREMTEFRFPTDFIAWATYTAQGLYANVPISQIKAVCFYSPWQFLFWYDRPFISREVTGRAPDSHNVIGTEPELEFFAQCPTVWDDTKVLHGSIGRYAVIARRSGDNWFIGGMNSDEPRSLDIPLQFLDAGRKYTAHLYCDDPTMATRTHVRIERLTVDRGTVLRVAMPARGGQAIRLVPAVKNEESAEIVTLEPGPLAGILLNPGKGWSAGGLPDRHPQEVLDLLGMGVMRLDWSSVEPQEGQYNWTSLDRFLDSWGRLGRVCNIGIMCANTHSRAPEGYVTPKWVFDAGAKKIEIMLDPDQSTTGTPGRKVAPVFDDPIFLARFANFLRAFANRYDGDPRIAVLDIRSYGNWGEAHMHPFGGPDIAPEQFRRHVQMHLDAFRKTQECHPAKWMPGQPAVEKARMDYSNVPAGKYRLALALTRNRGDATPWIRLGTDLPTVDGWYVLGQMEVAR